jgi:hypothetical protein
MKKHFVVVEPTRTGSPLDFPDFPGSHRIVGVNKSASEFLASEALSCFQLAVRR